MKTIIILGDGMADEPLKELGFHTPLELAKKPHIDGLAREGEVGLIRTTPDGMPPSSDVANLAVMGYDPRRYYTGRSSLEAVSMGVPLDEADVTFRCNLVTLSDEQDYRQKTMIDYSADEISTSEAAALIGHLGGYFNSGAFSLHAGISYRHCLKWADGKTGLTLTPPHDILDKPIADHLPAGDGSEALLDMMQRSFALLSGHPVNLDRKRRGLRPANSMWFWGEAKKPMLPSFETQYGVKGAVISAVDLIKGIGICAGLQVVNVEGATGNIHTNFAGKAHAALRALDEGCDFVYVHLEAPDECGHRFEIQNKIRSIELIDEKVVGVLLEALRRRDEAFCMAVLPDHPTPLALRTHTRAPVPYVVFRSGQRSDSGVETYSEKEAAQTGVFIEQGHLLMKKLLARA